MHHGFSSSHFKGPMFLFLSSHWCSLAVPTSRQQVANTNQRPLLYLLGLPSDSEVHQGAEKEADQNTTTKGSRSAEAFVAQLKPGSPGLSWPFTHAWNLDQVTGHSSRNSNDSLKPSKSANISFTSSNVSWAPFVHALQLKKIKPN